MLSQCWTQCPPESSISGISPEWLHDYLCLQRHALNEEAGSLHKLTLSEQPEPNNPNLIQETRERITLGTGRFGWTHVKHPSLTYPICTVTESDHFHS